MRLTVLCGVLFLSALTAAPAGAVETVLYDGTLGTAPEAQGWLAYQALAGTATRTTAGGATTLDTTPAPAGNAESAGFATYRYLGAPAPVNPALPSLDRLAGYAVELDLRVLSEAHASTDRAGVSLIAISDADAEGRTLGIELGFWTDRVFAQGATFTPAEGTSFATTGATQYALNVQGATYRLLADGSEILTGPLREYASPAVPYGLENFVFVGDDTTSARGSFEFSRLAIDVVPEPSVGLLAVLALGCGLGGRRSRSKSA